MSFVRVGRPTQQHTKGKRPVRTKRAAAPKKDWVSTVNDLSVHKPTPAELSHRHEIHKSHNKAAAQWELREKALQRRLRHSGSHAPLDQASLSIIREVFSDKLLLQDVLARSDRAMAVVKDLFGDAPQRQTGHPSVTMAPNSDSDSALLPVLQREDPPTQLSLLSQSIMDQQALNEVDGSEEEYSDEDGSSEYHFQRANLQKMKAQSRGRLLQQRKSGHQPPFEQADRDNEPLSPCTSGRTPNLTALNATVAVQRVQSRRRQSEEGKEEPSVLVSQVLNPELHLNQSGRIRNRISRPKCISQSSELNGTSMASLSGDHSSLGLLQAMLGQVEADLDTLSPDTDPTSARCQEPHRKQGLTGFSVALVSTLGRLVNLLKQKEGEAHKEAWERKRLEEDLREQRGLIDALTAETMTLREEAAALQARLQQQIAELEQKLDTVVLVMGDTGLLKPPGYPHQDSDIIPAVCQPAPKAADRDPQLKASASPAVLISPPRQRNNLQQIPVSHPALLKQECFSANASRPRRDSSASSLTSLPLSSLPFASSVSLLSDPLGSEISPEAMLAEIAQLSRENDLIKAQLSQAKGPGSVCGGLPSNGQTGLNSSSTGRVTPQSVHERKASIIDSKRRQSQHIQAAEREHLTAQESSPLSTVEQRLLELNRQSAAARGRLLELIEQQKQNVSARVSPSGSPIPTSAISPQTAGGGGSPESLTFVPEQELPSHSGAYEKRYAASEMSSQSLGREKRNGKTQVEKRREKEGWFSLSAHVR